MHAKSLQLCLILYYPMDCKWPGSSVHGISQARILEWVAIPCFRGSSWPRNQTHVCSISLTGRQRWYWWINNFPFKAANARDVGLVPGLGSSPGKGNGNPLQCSCLGNPMDRGAWRATVHGPDRLLLQKMKTQGLVQGFSNEVCFDQYLFRCLL